MQHSCERNRNQAKANIYPTNPTNYKPPGIGQIKTNGVMFGEIMMTDDGYDHCVKTFTDLYQCKGVPVGYTGNKKENQNFQECKNWWDPKTPECKSCKLAFPNIQIPKNWGSHVQTMLYFENIVGLETSCCFGNSNCIKFFFVSI